MIRDELNVRSFDTGFPLDFGDVVRQLGPDVTVQGGSAMLLLHGIPDTVASECRRIINKIMPYT